MMDRRTLLAGTGAVFLAAPLAAEAQPATKVARIGYLVGSLAGGPHLPEAFHQGLRDLGYVEGWHRLLGRPVSESGTLCHRGGAHGRGDRAAGGR